MGRKFGNEGKAIALRTSPDLLTSAVAQFLGRNGPCYLGQIRYIDHDVDKVPEANTIEVAFVVQRKFCFQQEARLYLHMLSDSAYQILTRTNLCSGQNIVRLAKPKELLEFENEIVGNIPKKLGEGSHKKHDGKALILPTSSASYIEEILIGSKVRDPKIRDLKRLLEGTVLANRIRHL